MSDRRSRKGGIRSFTTWRAVIEVFTKCTGAHRVHQVSLGRGDDAQVDGLGRGGADRLDFAFLDHAQQLRLHREVHRIDLVEEQRAAMRRPDATGLAELARRAVDLVAAEQLGLCKVVRQRGAVYGDERRGAAPALAVEHMRDEFLAGSRLPLDEHVEIGLRELRDRLAQPQHRCLSPISGLSIAAAAAVSRRLSRISARCASARRATPTRWSRQGLGEEVEGAVVERRGRPSRHRRGR